MRTFTSGCCLVECIFNDRSAICWITDLPQECSDALREGRFFLVARFFARGAIFHTNKIARGALPATDYDFRRARFHGLPGVVSVCGHS
jgi:hypothetical protein